MPRQYRHRIYKPLNKSYYSRGTSTMTVPTRAATAAYASIPWASYMNKINEGIKFARAANSTYFNAKKFYEDARGSNKAKGNSTHFSKQSKGNIHTGGYTSYGANYSKNVKTKGKKGWKGKLTVPHNKKKTKQYNKKLPHSIMQRYFLTPYGNLDSNGILSYPQDMLKSNPSLDAKHMSVVVLNLSASENHLNPHRYNIGKQNVPYSTADVDENNRNAIIWENKTDNSELDPYTIPYQVNKFPVSAFSSRWMTPTGGSGTVEYEVPTSVITGVNLNLVFKAGGQPFDQVLSVKIVRCTVPEPFKPGEWGSVNGVASKEVIQRELCNRANFTSRLAFETIWTKSIKLRGIKGGAQKIPTVRLKKFIKMQYLRSNIRRVSTAGDQATLGSMALPTTYESQEGYFNNLYVVISSKTVDDQYVATVSRDLTGQPSGEQYAREELGALRSIPAPAISATGYDNETVSCFFRFGGTFSIYRKVKECDSGITGGLNQTAQNVLSLQDQINELQAIVGAHQDDDCTSCDEDSDHSDSSHDSGVVEEEVINHTHPNANTDPAVGYDEHSHPGTNTHSH